MASKYAFCSDRLRPHRDLRVGRVPGLMLEDLGHRSASDSVLSCELRDFSIAPSSAIADFCDLFWSQFRPSVASTSVIRSPLPNHVLHVLCVSPYEQMTRIDALRRITRMANLKGLRNGTVKVFVQPAMSAGDSGSSWAKASV